MERDSNEGRFDALTGMLKERGLAFQVEPFTIEPHKREPRTQGRNIVVTIPGRSEEHTSELQSRLHLVCRLLLEKKKKKKTKPIQKKKKKKKKKKNSNNKIDK